MWCGARRQYSERRFALPKMVKTIEDNFLRAIYIGQIHSSRGQTSA